MRISVLAVASLAVLSPAARAMAQGQAAAYQQQRKSFRFAGDTLARYEWTRDIPAEEGLVNEDRYFVQARPRVELNLGPIELGVGGAFNYSDVENDVPPPDQIAVLLIRDNFRSRDARLDLAWAKLTAGPIVAQGGRFLMPIPFTEMVWDADLRPQGGAVALRLSPESSASRFALHGIYATGSHVFEDESVMYGGGVELSFTSGQDSTLQLVGSYLQFEDLEKLAFPIRRQNTLEAGAFVNEYRVVDLIARLGRGGQLPMELVANYCWNTSLEEDNRGLWLAAVLGNLGTSRARAEYTYAKVDRDATVAAFNTDDFYWGTGWEGHRADLATGTVKSSSIHAIAQWQRFKDSPDPAVREQWVTRYRLEWRTSF
ncbi:MAG TPA: hypothetical protein VLL75_14960 [Vicinamibacteria bacterium]|nr:hypothetical protein [Vicinamibacteria bacterium]